MPKIRLSALVADIKGKANGSVFSTNRGGLYYRNNPSGGGRNSTRWGTQKNNFSSLASLWRSLTIAQRDAWNTAAPDYPTTDAFGNPRIPSGYELFMRLNGALSSNGFPTISVPQSPSTFPDIGATKWETPDLHLYVPSTSLAMYDLNNPSNRFHATVDDFIVAAMITDPRTVNMMVKVPEVGTYPLNTSHDVELFTLTDGGDNVMKVFLSNTNQDPVKLTVDFVLMAGSCTIESDIPQSVIKDWFHVSVVTTDTGADNSLVYVNGEPVLLNINSAGSQQSSVANYQLIIGNPDNEIQNNLRVAFAKGEEVIEKYRDNVRLSLGYYLDTEYFAIGGNLVLNDIWPNQAGGDTPPSAMLVGWDASYKTVINDVPATHPELFLNVANTGNPGQYLILYASAPLSSGRNLITNNLKRIAVIDWATLDEYEFTTDWHEVFNTVSNGSTLSLAYQLLDSNTGQLSSVKTFVSNPTREKGFKAGSELSGKVN